MKIRKLGGNLKKIKITSVFCKNASKSCVSNTGLSSRSQSCSVTLHQLMKFKKRDFFRVRYEDVDFTQFPANMLIFIAF